MEKLSLALWPPIATPPNGDTFTPAHAQMGESKWPRKEEFGSLPCVAFPFRKNAGAVEWIRPLRSGAFRHAIGEKDLFISAPAPKSGRVRPHLWGI